jgi:hypothetical protein
LPAGIVRGLPVSVFRHTRMPSSARHRRSATLARATAPC